MNIRTLAVPAVILLSGSMLAACGDTEDDLDAPVAPTVGGTVDEPTMAPPMDEDPIMEEDPLVEDDTNADA